jgi:beta-glucosidase
MPNGPGQISNKGVALYRRLLSLLRKHNIRANLTAYHWDLPKWAADKGGWLNRETAEHFANFCTVLGQQFGDLVDMWGTINEPEVIVAGYIGDGLAPGLSDPSLRVQAAHNVMLAHGLGTMALRAVNPNFKIGLSLNLVPQEANDGANSIAVAAAETRWMRHYAVYLEAILKGRYPDVVLKEAAATGVVIQPGDMEIISQPIDWLGINWYWRQVVDDKGEVLDKQPGWNTTLMGWEIHAPALTRMLLRMNGDYKLPPVYITENGAALTDTIDADGRIRDVGRMQYIHDHIGALLAAAKAGVNIAGYYAWSLMDNLEWSLGFKMTFGLVHVRRDTLERVWKDSAFWFRDMIKANIRQSREHRSSRPRNSDSAVRRYRAKLQG